MRTKDLWLLSKSGDQQEVKPFNDHEFDGGGQEYEDDASDQSFFWCRLVRVLACTRKRRCRHSRDHGDFGPHLEVRRRGIKGDEPLVVTVNRGDILLIEVPGGKHGFVTLNKKGTDNPAPAKQFVWACGQPEFYETKKAAFREVQCGASSNFGKLFTGKMRLEVTDKLKDDVNFWCVQHTRDMWGVVKLKP